MAQQSKIEWTDVTWNPVTGCSKVSPGCNNCYASRMAIRLKSMAQPRYNNGFNVTLQKDIIELPLQWKQPKLIFVNSMSDLFHPQVPSSYIKNIFEIMNSSYWHTFQILTKRSERLNELHKELKWTKNIWIGVSVENSNFLNRITHLNKVNAAIKFVSFEPLLERIESKHILNVDWIIVGGESGPNARPMKIEWVREIRDLCIRKKIPFFFKQWGGKRKSLHGRTLDDKIWDEMPMYNYNIQQ